MHIKKRIVDKKRTNTFRLKNNMINEKMIEKRDVATVILVNEKNEVLLQKKDMGYKWLPGCWCMFGGGVEKGEDPLSALKRELVEELHLTIEDLTFFKSEPYEVSKGKIMRKGTHFCFVAKYLGEISDIRIAEGCGFAFFSSEELKDYKLMPLDKLFLEGYYKI